MEFGADQPLDRVAAAPVFAGIRLPPEQQRGPRHLRDRVRPIHQHVAVVARDSHNVGVDAAEEVDTDDNQ